MSQVSEAELSDGVAEREFVKEPPIIEENDERLHDIEHIGEDIKNKISSAGLSGPTLVDDLFKTFLAKKMEDIESAHKKQKKKKKKEKKDEEDGSKSRKHKKKHKKKHKSKSSRKKSRSSDHDEHSRLDHGSSKEGDVERKSDHGSNSASSWHSKFDHGSEVSRHGSNFAGTSSQIEQVDQGPEDDRHRSNTGNDARPYSTLHQRSEKDHSVGACDPKRDSDHRSFEDVDHEGKSAIEGSNMDDLETSEVAESNRTVYHKIESAVCVTDITEHGIKYKTEEEGVIAKPLLGHCKDGQERICDIDANCQHIDFNSAPIPGNRVTVSCEIMDHFCVEKDSRDSEVAENVGRGLEVTAECCSSPDLGKEGVRDVALVLNETETSDRAKGLEDHGTRTEDQGTRSGDQGFRTEDQGSGKISTDLSKDPNDQSKDHGMKPKDLDKHSSSRSKDGFRVLSEQSDKAAQGKSSSNRKGVDCDNGSKDHGSRSRDHRSRSKDRGSGSKDCSRDHNRDDKSKDHGNHSKDKERSSKDRNSRSKDCQRNSRDRDDQSKTHSKNQNSQPEDRGRRSKDHEQRSIDDDIRSKNRDARSSEKDPDKMKSSSEKKRDRSRSKDHGRKSTEHDMRSKDCRKQSKDRSAPRSEVDRACDRTKASSSDRKKDRSKSKEDRMRSKDRSRSKEDRRRSKDRSRSKEDGKRSKDRSGSKDRSKRRRSREICISDGDSDIDDSCRRRRLKSKKQKEKKRRERSVEIIEDEEMESPEASERLTERLLKRLNTSIKRGQELKGEKDTLPDTTEVFEVVDLEELDCGEVVRMEEQVVDLEGIAVSTFGDINESFSSVAVSTADMVSGVTVSDGGCQGVSDPVQGPVMEVPPAVHASVTKSCLGKGRKPMMKMGIRLTESSMAIISSGVQVKPEQLTGAEEQVKTGISEEHPDAGDVLARDFPSEDGLPKQQDKDLLSETLATTDLNKAMIKGDADGGRSPGLKETNLKSESRKRRRSRSKERRTKKSNDNRSRDMTPAKKSESRTKDVGRRSRSRSKNRSRKSRSRSKNRSRKSRSRSKNRSRKSRSRSKNRSRKSRSRSNDRRRKSKSCSRERRRVSRSQSKDRRQSQRGGRSGSPAKDKLQEDLRLKIDKARLREIAIKKVYGNGPKGGVGPVFDMKPDEVVAFKSGGKSVEELTDFCKRIAEKEKNQLTESPSPEAERPASEDEDMPFTANAFKAREMTNSIVLNIRNSKPLPILSSQEKVAKAAELRTQFPVSSGTQHRAKEWVPVEKMQPGVHGPSTGNPPHSGATESAVVEDKVFPDPPAQQIDVGQVVSERLSALRKLQSNPNDVQALGNVFKSQQQMQQWAASKQLPGQFLGSTGMTVLPQRDIFNHNPRNQAWVKKDTFTRAPPVDSGIGKMLLQRMGWKEGEGLGRNSEGMTQPLMVDIKMDRKGLTTGEETGRKGQMGMVASTPIRFDFSGKHPVSALNEICTKRKWNMPNFILMEETGPSHSRTFRFKVEVNNVEYVPLTTSSTKKTAKLEAATVCLQQLGLLPRS